MLVLEEHTIFPRSRPRRSRRAVASRRTRRRPRRRRSRSAPGARRRGADRARRDPPRRGLGARARGTRGARPASRCARSTIGGLERAIGQIRLERLDQAPGAVRLEIALDRDRPRHGGDRAPFVGRLGMENTESSRNVSVKPTSVGEARERDARIVRRDGERAVGSAEVEADASLHAGGGLLDATSDLHKRVGASARRAVTGGAPLSARRRENDLAAHHALPCRAVARSRRRGPTTPRHAQATPAGSCCEERRPTASAPASGAARSAPASAPPAQTLGIASR